MKSFLNNHLYKTIILITCLCLVLSVILFEKSVAYDRKNFENGKKTAITGIIQSIPSVSEYSTSFILKPKGNSKIKNLVYVKISNSKSLSLCIGDTIHIRGLCTVPDKAMNPGAFDFADYIKSKGASLVLESDIVHVLSHRQSILAPIYTLRTKITQKIASAVSPDEAGLINAIVTGDKGLISDERADTYRKSGIYHVVAVSGLHLNMLILFLSVLYTKLALSKRKKTILSLGLSLAACGFMIIFTGFGISVQRAAFMALSVCAAGVLFREYSPAMSLFWAFALMLLQGPHLYADASFCLSFSATAGILMALSVIKRIPSSRFKWLWESLCISLLINLNTMPFLVKFFGAVSLVSPLTNLVVLCFVPVLLGFSYLFALLCPFCSGPVLEIVAAPATTIAYCTNLVADIFSKPHIAYVYISRSLMPLIIIAVIGVLFFALTRSKRLRVAILSAIIVANCGYLVYNNSVPDYSTVTFVNAGQGDCNLIHSSDGASIMIDCGSESVWDFGQNQAVPYLRNLGIKQLDLVIITHFHDDHTSGLPALIRSGMVKHLVLPDRGLAPDEKIQSDEIYRLALENDIPITHASRDSLFRLGDHTLKILNPKRAVYSNANNASMVVEYTYKGKKVLFCADIEEEGQYDIINLIADCDIIKIPHHGGKSALSRKLADKASGDYAVISCGENNKYSHPAKETLDAYQNYEIIRTDTEMEPISFVLNSEEIRRN